MSDIDDTDDNDDFHKDRNELSYGELLNDLRNNQNKNLKWLLEEFEIQFDAQLNETKKDETRPVELVKKMIPYFLRLINDEGTNRSEICPIWINSSATPIP